MAKVLFKRAYKYRLYPTTKQAEKLQWALDHVRELYNAAVQERRDAYDIGVKRHPNYYDEAIPKHLTKAYAIDYQQQAATPSTQRVAGRVPGDPLSGLTGYVTPRQENL